MAEDESPVAPARTETMRDVAFRPVKLTRGDRKLWRELSATFPEGLNWVATDGEKIDLGISQRLKPATPATAAPDPERVIVAKITVLEATPGGHTPVHRASFIVRRGQKATLVGSGKGVRVRYECLPGGADGEGLLRLAVSVTRESSGARGLLASEVRFGGFEPTEAGRLTVEDTTHVIRVGAATVRTSELNARPGTRS